MNLVLLQLEYIKLNEGIRIHDRKNAPWFWLQQSVQEPNLQGNNLILQTALFFYASTQLANPELLVTFLDLFLSI